MKIHTNSDKLTLTAISDALTAEKEAGRIAQHVTFKGLARKGSRSHRAAFEIQLEAAVRDRGRRYGNSGSYGATSRYGSGEGSYAATYDEWGWLLAALYALDDELIVGTPRYPIYTSEDDFHHKTGRSYDASPEAVQSWEEDGDPYPFVDAYSRAGSTKKGWQVGRFGYGRALTPNNWSTCKPRSIEDFRAHAHLNTTTATSSATPTATLKGGN